MKRRKFLRTVSATGLGIAGAPRLPSWLRSPAETVVVAVMGLNNRGSVLGRAFARAANATVAYVCDVDSQVLSKGVTAVAGGQTKPPKGLRDFRKALDDKDVDALVIAAPDHCTRPRRSWRCAPGNTSTWRSRAGITPARASCWWMRNASTGEWYRWGLSSARRRSRSS